MHSALLHLISCASCGSDCEITRQRRSGLGIVSDDRKANLCVLRPIENTRIACCGQIVSSASSTKSRAPRQNRETMQPPTGVWPKPVVPPCETLSLLLFSTGGLGNTEPEYRTRYATHAKGSIVAGFDSLPLKKQPTRFLAQARDTHSLRSSDAPARQGGKNATHRGEGSHRGSPQVQRAPLYSY